VSKDPIIDAHSHYLPKEIIRQASFYSEDWGNIERQLEFMDTTGVDLAILTYPTTDVVLKGKMGEVDVAKSYNDAIGQIVKRYPGRFLGTALLPLFDEKHMITELKRARDILGLKGISLASSYNGIYLDDERFYLLYEKVSEYNLPIFVHATTNNPIGSRRVVDPLLTPVIEFVFDITMCIGKLIMSSVFKEFPDLKFVFAHFGGVMPFIKERLDTTYRMLRKRILVRDISAMPSDYLKRIYVDISGSASPSAIMCTIEVMGIERIFWGSDYPANMDLLKSIETINGLDITERQKAQILGKNVERLMIL